MIDALVSMLQGIPAWLATAIIAAFPIGELRVALPVGVTVYHLPLATALIASYIGNAIPVFILLPLLRPFLRAAEKHWPALHRLMSRYFDSVHRRNKASYEKYGKLALCIFVAIPLPLTGVWSGCALATVLGLPMRQSLGPILLGMIIAGIIVALVLQGTLGFLSFLI